MRLKIMQDEDREVVSKIRKGLKENNGFCPCEIFQTEDTKCICKAFREQKVEGNCHCGLYKKVEVK